MSLFDALSKISGDIQKQRNLIKKEAAIKQVSVQPFIKALGYNTNNLSEVEEEFDADAADGGGERVDYAIKLAGEPIVLIEAKQANAILSGKFWKQLHHYVGATDALFGVLTNGIEYRFYTDLKKSNVMDKEPFLVIDMLNLDDRLVAELEWFTKSSFDPDRIKAGAQKQVILGLLKQEMDRPSEALVKHFSRQIHSGRLNDTDIKRYAELLKDAWRDNMEQEIAKQLNSALESKTASDKTETECFDGAKCTPPPVSGKDIPIFGYHDGHRFEAELLRKTMDRGLQIARHHIRYNGETTWLKNAAVEAIRSVDPSFAPTRTYPNGFKFWYVVDPADGKEHMIRSISGWDRITDEALRQRVLSS